LCSRNNSLPESTPINAKRAALEEAGTYLSSLSEVKNFEMTKDEISSLAAGVIAVKVLDEKWSMDGESPVVVLTINATVNTDDLEKRVNALKENSEMVENYKDIQAELSRLKQELEDLKEKKINRYQQSTG
jgi:hypothetical protein